MGRALRWTAGTGVLRWRISATRLERAMFSISRRNSALLAAPGGLAGWRTGP